MSLLNSVLEAIEKADGPLSLGQLGLALGVEPSALEGMVGFWVRKGRLRVVGAADGTLCAVTGCSACSAAGPTTCPLIVNEPTRYEVIRQNR